MQVPILSGVVANEMGEFEISPPINLEPIIIDSKIAKSQLRIAPGAVTIATGPGADRAAISWNDQCYRVMGTKLVKVGQDNSVTEIGDVGGDGYAALDYGFTLLGIGSGNGLYFYDGMTLSQNTDEDLGIVIDMLWIDGYYMFTDGTYVGVTELSDPFQVIPLKYGSAEEDPDMVTGLIKVREEAYVCGRFTIQVYQNIGGNGFPFQSIKGATIERGCVAPGAKCPMGETFAFCGSGRNEALGIHVAGAGQSSKISDRRVDRALASVVDPTLIRLECRTSDDETRLYVHLPEETWVFYAKASEATGQKVWTRHQSAVDQPYRLRNAVNVAGRWIVGDVGSGVLGEWVGSTGAHFGEAARWQFDVGMLYSPGAAGIMHRVELVGLPGRGDESNGASIGMSITLDGEVWSSERFINAGGSRLTRMQWRPHVRVVNYAGLRFSGYNKMLPGFAACDVS